MKAKNSISAWFVLLLVSPTASWPLPYRCLPVGLQLLWNLLHSRVGRADINLVKRQHLVLNLGESCSSILAERFPSHRSLVWWEVLGGFVTLSSDSDLNMVPELTHTHGEFSPMV